MSLCLVAFVSAQVSTTTGTVVSNSGGTLVVDTDSGQRTFMVDAQSSLPADLAAGTRVTVEYHTLANDKFHAFKVTPAGTSPTTPATTTTTTDTTMAPPVDTTTTATTTAPETTAPAPAAPTMVAPTAAPSTTTTTTTTTQTPPTNTMDNTTTSDTTTRTTMDDDSATTGSRLPATASPLPLLALAGSLALAGGLLLRRRRA